MERLKRWRGHGAPCAGACAGAVARGVRRARRAADRLGEIDEALRTAEEGMEGIPRLPTAWLTSACSRRRAALTGQIRKLREDPAAPSETTLTYTQLSQIYRELGSHDEALGSRRVRGALPAERGAVPDPGREIRVERVPAATSSRRTASSAEAALRNGRAAQLANKKTSRRTCTWPRSTTWSACSRTAGSTCATS